MLRQNKEVIGTTNSNDAGNGNGSGSYQPSKTWILLGENTWFEDDEEKPGQERLIDTEALQDELGIDQEPEEN